MSDSLFRKEAVAHQKATFLGDVLLTQPLPLKIITGFVATVAVSLILFLCLGTYTPRETVLGHLVPDKGIAKLYAPNSATVTTVQVEEGQAVEVGQVLLTARHMRDLEEGHDVDTLTLVQLEDMQTELLAQMNQEERLNQAEVKKIATQIHSQEQELVQIAAQIQTQSERLKIVEKRLAGVHQLYEQGNLSEIGYQNYQEEVLLQQQQLEDLKRQQASKESALAGLLAMQTELPIQLHNKQSTLKNQQAELVQKKAEVSARQQFILKAPMPGLVTALQVKPGQVIPNNNMLLLSILPQDTVMYAELFVPTRAIGFVKVGQRVHLRYTAFPHEKFGVQKGQITEVTQVVLAPNELPINIGVEEPVYRVRVALDKQSIIAYGEELPLGAGLHVEADIVLEKRALIEWLLAPLFSFKGRLS